MGHGAFTEMGYKNMKRGMGENIFEMEILFSAQFTLSSVKNSNEVLF